MRREQRNDYNRLRGLILHLWYVWQIRVIHKFRVSLDDKILQVNNFLLFNFVLFSYRERVISKYLTLVLAYVSITNNLKLTTNFLPIIMKFQRLIHNNNFRLGILL